MIYFISFHSFCLFRRLPYFHLNFILYCLSLLFRNLKMWFVFENDFVDKFTDLSFFFLFIFAITHVDSKLLQLFECISLFIVGMANVLEWQIKESCVLLNQLMIQHCGNCKLHKREHLFWIKKHKNMLMQNHKEDQDLVQIPLIIIILDRQTFLLMDLMDLLHLMKILKNKSTTKHTRFKTPRQNNFGTFIKIKKVMELG